MLALKEFANFITLDMANLAANYARLLADSSEVYNSIPLDQRIALTRRNLKAVVDSCLAQNSTPLLKFFDTENNINNATHRLNRMPVNNALIEVECLGQTLTPVVTSLEAGKFFWHLLADVRAVIISSSELFVPSQNVTYVHDTSETKLANEKYKSDDAGKLKQTGVTSAKPEEFFRNLEEENRDLAEFLNAIINSIADPVFAKDEVHRWIVLNNSMLEFMGGKREDLLGKTDYDIFPKEEADVFWEQDDKVFASSQPIENEEFFTDIYGKRHIISTKKAAHRLPNGQKILTGTIRDITEQKQIEKNLRNALRENERLSTAISNAAIGVVISDPHQSDNPLLYVNAAFTKITGYSAKEVIGQNCRFLQGPDTDPLAVDVIREAIKQEKSCSVVLLNYRQDGSPFWNELTINPVFDEVGVLINYIGIQMDVTARQQAEIALLRRASELETVAQVSIATATILDVDQLLQQVVDLTKHRFDLYHAHIYLVDKKETVLKLAAGAGEIGRKMVDQGWQISIEREDSLVARTARNRQAIIVGDVRKEPGYLPNPLLPDTRSEMTVPMIVGEQLLGVLDVQSNRLGRFTDEDAQIKMILASQITVALQNAIQHEETQKALVEIKNSQELLRSVIDATPDWIFIKDREHRYQLVNKGYAQDLGIKTEDFIGKNDLELGFSEEIVKGNPEKEIVGFWNYDDDVFDTGQTIFIDSEPADINEKQLFQNTIKAPVRDSDGNIQGVLGYVRDITEREQLLARTRQLYEASAELSKAKSYLDIIQVIQKYTIASDAEYVSLGHFGQPVPIGDPIPDKVQMLARWSDKSESLVQSDYDLNEFPGLRKYLQPQPVVVEDFSRETIDANTKDLYDSLNAKTLVYVPIVVAGQWNGFIAIIYQHQKVFSEVEMQRALAIASQVSVAVQNLYNVEQVRQSAIEAEHGREQLARYSERLHKLQDITRGMARELQPSLETYRTSLDAIAELLNAHYAALALLNEKGEYAHFIYRGISDEQAKLIGEYPMGKGLLGVLLTEGQPLRIKDIRKDDRSTAMPEHHPQMHSFLGVPVIFQDQTLGRIYFAEHAEGEFGPDDEALATSFAASLASTLQSAKLFETIQKRAKELEIVSELGIQISTVLDPNLLLSSVVDLTKESFELCLVQVYLFDETEQSLKLAIASGEYDDMVYEGISISIDEEHSPIARAARTREGVFVENLQQRPETIRLSQFPYAEAEISMPLITGQNLIGVLDVQTDEVNRFAVEDLQIQKILAGQVAIALDNVDLFEQLQRRAQREQTIREVTEKLRAAPNLEKLVKTATEELVKHLSATHASMELGIDRSAKRDNDDNFKQINGNTKDYSE